MSAALGSEVPILMARFHLPQANEYQVPVLMNCLIDGVGACDTNDIAEPHPTRKGFWKIVGRADDQIMHSTGEKVVSLMQYFDKLYSRYS